MAHVDIVLRPPSYGWKDDKGELVIPTNAQVLREFADRMNIFKSRKAWLAVSSWASLFLLAPFFVAFFALHFSWPLLVVGFLYGMVGLGSHGTVWYHRFGTHKAFEFSHPIFRSMTRHLVVKTVPEEIYIVSHFVHHSKGDEPGDPYNPQAGFLYCFLADAIHQPIAQDMSEKEYNKTLAFVAHTGMTMNSYEQYKVWGSIANPFVLWTERLANWTFWYGFYYMIGGHALACAIFAGACTWNAGIRTYNYGAHGSGEDLKVEGEDFYATGRSINQLWPGIVAGEWHNNHHLFARSARSGYKWWQIDIPYYYVRVLHFFGAVSTYRDSKEAFFSKYYLPYLAAKRGEDVGAKAK